MPEYPLFHLPEIGWLVAYRKATSHVELTGALRKQHSEYQKATLQEMEKSERAKQLNKHRHATILIVAGAIKNNTYKIIHWLSVVIGGRGILRITSIHAAHQFELRVTAMDQAPQPRGELALRLSRAYPTLAARHFYKMQGRSTNRANLEVTQRRLMRRVRTPAVTMRSSSSTMYRLSKSPSRATTSAP